LNQAVLLGGQREDKQALQEHGVGPSAQGNLQPSRGLRGAEARRRMSGQVPGRHHTRNRASPWCKVGDRKQATAAEVDVTQRFMREVSIYLDQSRLGSQATIAVAVSDPKAYIERVQCVDRLDGGREVVFYVRDRGDFGDPKNYIGVDLSMRTGGVTLMAATSGRFLGRISTRGGQYHWYVFARHPGALPDGATFYPSPRTIGEAPPSPGPGSAGAAPACDPGARLPTVGLPPPGKAQEPYSL
jgi:hypothetical protein